MVRSLLADTKFSERNVSRTVSHSPVHPITPPVHLLRKSRLKMPDCTLESQENFLVHVTTSVSRTAKVGHLSEQEVRFL